MNEIAIISELTYRCYAYNRRLAPHITPEGWRKVFGKAVDWMEPRFQAEIKKEVAE